MDKKIVFAIIGGLLGLPLSYYFQPELLQNKVGGIWGYLEKFDRILDNSNFSGNVVLSVVIFAIVGGIIGYFVDENEAKKSN